MPGQIESPSRPATPLEPLTAAGAALVLLAHGGALWAVLQLVPAPVVPPEGAPLLAEFVMAPAASPAPAAPPVPAPARPAPPRAEPLPRPVVPPPAVLATQAPAASPAPAATVPASVAPASAAPTSLAPDTPSRPAGAADPAARAAAVAMPAAAPRLLPSSVVQYRVLPAIAVPAASRRAGEQGTVWLRVHVGRDGLPRDIRVHRSSGHERLDEQALAAMAAARFQPQIQQGEPIEWIVIAPLQYELE